MGKILPVFVLLTILVAVNASDVRLEAKSRMRRGFSNGGFGSNDGGSAYGRGGDEQDASVSRESIGGCSGESGRSFGGSRELEFNRDGRSSNENRRGGRSFSKASASASAIATAFNQNQKPVA